MSKKTNAQKEQDKYFYPVLVILSLVGVTAFATSAPILYDVGETLHLPWPVMLPFMIDGSIIAFGVAQVYSEMAHRLSLRIWSIIGTLSFTLVSLAMSNFHAVTQEGDSMTIMMSMLVHSLPMLVLALSIHVVGIMARPPKKMSRLAKRVAHATGVVDTQTVTDKPEVDTRATPPSVPARVAKKRAKAKTSHAAADRAKVLMAHVKSGDKTVEEMALTIGVSKRTCQRVLSQMAEDGMIEKDGTKWVPAKVTS